MPPLPSGPSNLASNGCNFFSNLITPIFNLETMAIDLRFAPCAKDKSVVAPAGAPVGQDSDGSGAAA